MSLAIRGPITRGDVPGLLARAQAVMRSERTPLRCELVGVAADAVSVDALARIRLAASRRRRSLQIGGMSAELQALIELMGLADLLRD